MRTKPQSLIFNVQNYYYFNGLFFQKKHLEDKNLWPWSQNGLATPRRPVLIRSRHRLVSRWSGVSAVKNCHEVLETCMWTYRQTHTTDMLTNISSSRVKKGKGSPYSITKHRVPELIPVLGSQPAGDVSHKPGSRLPLLSVRPSDTLATLKRAAINFTAW